MTGKRAVEIIMEMLNEGDILGDIRLTDERIEALKFAAEVLERPSGDCISREALKEDLVSYDREFVPVWVLNRIDNAPTVETFTLEDMRKEVRKNDADNM